MIIFYQHQRLILFAMDRICAAPEEFEGCSLTGGQTLCICLAVISSGSKVLSRSNGATCKTKHEHLQASAVTHQAQSDITPSHGSNKLSVAGMAGLSSTDNAVAVDTDSHKTSKQAVHSDGCARKSVLGTVKLFNKTVQPKLVCNVTLIGNPSHPAWPQM